MKALLHSVLDQPDATSVHAQFDKLLRSVAGPLPAVAEHLDAARDDILACTGVPGRALAAGVINCPNERLNGRSGAASTWWAASS